MRKLEIPLSDNTKTKTVRFRHLIEMSSWTVGNTLPFGFVQCAFILVNIGLRFYILNTRRFEIQVENSGVGLDGMGVDT